MIPSQSIRLTDANPKKIQMLLSDTDFKAAIITILSKVKKTITMNGKTLDKCHYTSIQAYRTFSINMNPNVNYRLWIIMMFQCRFINCEKKKVSLWYRDVDNGGNYVCEGQEVYLKYLHFSLNFAVT